MQQHCHDVYRDYKHSKCCHWNKLQTIVIQLKVTKTITPQESIVSCMSYKARLFLKGISHLQCHACDRIDITIMHLLDLHNSKKVGPKMFSWQFNHLPVCWQHVFLQLFMHHIFEHPWTWYVMDLMNWGNIFKTWSFNNWESRCQGFSCMDHVSNPPRHPL